MKTKEVKGVARRAYGRAIETLDNESGTKLAAGTTIPFKGVANIFSSAEEMKQMGQWPTDKRILTLINRSLIAKARNKAQTDAFDALGIIKPDEKNDATIKVRNMVKMLIPAGYTPEDALTEARRLLKLDANNKPLVKAEATDEDADDDSDDESEDEDEE